MFLSGGRHSQFKNYQTVFVTNWKKSVAHNIQLKNTIEIERLWSGGIKLFHSCSIRIKVLHRSKTTEKAKSQVTDSPRLLKHLTTWIIIEISSNEFYDYTKQKKVKKFWTQIDCRPGRVSPSGYLVYGKHIPMCIPPFVLCFCAQNLTKPRILGWTIAN